MIRFWKLVEAVIIDNNLVELENILGCQVLKIKTKCTCTKQFVP